jgi:beta-xylosidase
MATEKWLQIFWSTSEGGNNIEEESFIRNAQVLKRKLRNLNTLPVNV